MRTVPWPYEEPKGVAVFDGPLCLGLSSSDAKVDLPWAVLVDASGRPVLDSRGRPQVVEPYDHKVMSLEPINSQWLTPDVKAPARYRILFRPEKVREVAGSPGQRERERAKPR